ncbi:CPBP family glutamic-type intramembrane protease [Deinococcus roseus]|uniref:CAAX prenyl protease 2/Lysostaphin resistance protein A-like domain-containing protein n=1 Tax=Deinococcus roseus TaxID=392414 RepID=A0ABQ2D1I7_9DEIO|nr:CPBP family glutamic-type intramembrane protease [Deinococcus roseus]GGJ40326.1 hypothetical protein GCM10008938_27980 [Deinococcus roseus]
MQLWVLVLFCLSTVLLIPFEVWLWGGLAWVASVTLTLLTREPALQRRMLVLLGCILLLALAPISTETSNVKFLTLGLPFLAVVALPPLLLRKTDPEVFSFRLLPEKFSKLEFIYTLLSAPLAYFAFKLYFALSPEVPFNWTLSPQPDSESLLRLFVGINMVGIWDELFFVNTCFAVLRSLFPFWKANWGQSVVYVSVLFDMAFRGVGPFFVLFLALTQGIMFQRSRALIYVLVVHLIVDYFLFQAIVGTYYPGFKAWWHP